MKVLFVSPLYDTADSGEYTTKALHDIVKHWVGASDVIVVRPRGIYLRELFSSKHVLKTLKYFLVKSRKIEGVSVWDVPVYKIPKIKYLMDSSCRSIDKILRRHEFQPDIVVAHFAMGLALGFHYASTKKLPYVAGLHSTDLHQCREDVFRKKYHCMVGYSSLVVCRSDFIRRTFLKWYPECEKKTIKVISGVPGEIIEPVSFFEKKLDTWVEKGTVQILTVSQLIGRKHIDKILIALSRLKTSVRWTYRIIGDGPERRQLTELTEELGLSDKVEFSGTIMWDDVLENMKESGVFILVSSAETLGLTYIEAMAKGNIVIGSKNEGIDGIIENNKNGFLVEAGNSSQLAHLLESLLVNPSKDMLQKTLVNSRSTVERMNDVEISRDYFNSVAGVLNP